MSRQCIVKIIQLCAWVDLMDMCIDMLIDLMGFIELMV